MHRQTLLLHADILIPPPPPPPPSPTTSASISDTMTAKSWQADRPHVTYMWLLRIFETCADMTVTLRPACRTKPWLESGQQGGFQGLGLHVLTQDKIITRLACV